MRDTIFAYSSGRGTAAIAVLRISGPGCETVITDLIGRALAPRRAFVVDLFDRHDGVLIDRCIAIWFPGPSSFTGEDCLELHTHGSKAVKDCLLRSLEQIPRLRPAEPGDFTRIAFRNGKLDLSQVEGLADLLESKTERQRLQALELMKGSLSNVALEWQEELLSCLALLEASIDFVDEEDVPTTVMNEVVERVQRLISEMSEAIQESRRHEVVKDGFRVAICGRPNVGKSSLLNWLAGRDVAIVSDDLGTTRDLLEIEIDWNGFLLVFVDGAGIRATGESIEKIGIERARANALRSNLILWLTDGDYDRAVDPVLANSEVEIVVIRTKADLLDSEDLMNREEVCISVEQNYYLDGLLELIGRRILDECDRMYSPGGLVHARHRLAVNDALGALLKITNDSVDWGAEVCAEELRFASRSISSITGTFGVEELLGRIFDRFCIGK